MLRVASFATLAVGLLSLAAYQSEDPKSIERPLPVNSTLANLYLPGSTGEERFDFLTNQNFSDSASSTRILMLNYSAFDSAYVDKMRAVITKRLPGAYLTDFWKGDAQDLTQALIGQHLVVVTYPSNGATPLVRGFGKVLKQFVQQGGGVVFSGTDQFGILQQYGLFELDFGYFCSGLEVHEVSEHPVLEETPVDFSLANYIYPLNISDPNFVVLADINGYPVIGYKSLGAGKIVYLGLEYYYDEAVSSQILENTIRWLEPERSERMTAGSQIQDNNNWASRIGRRSEERLFVGSGGAPSVNAPEFDLKVYPNPYMTKATLDVNLEKSAPVSIEMTDESGSSVAVILPNRVLNSGLYRLELPNVSPGVYFIKCRIGNQTTVRKVVKVATR